MELIEAMELIENTYGNLTITKNDPPGGTSVTWTATTADGKRLLTADGSSMADATISLAGLI